MLHRRTLLGFCTVLFAARSVRAASLAAPAGKVLLTVRGKIANTNADGSARFDLAMLDALPDGEPDGHTARFARLTGLTQPGGGRHGLAPRHHLISPCITRTASVTVGSAPI